MLVLTTFPLNEDMFVFPVYLNSMRNRGKVFDDERKTPLLETQARRLCSGSTYSEVERTSRRIHLWLTHLYTSTVKVLPGSGSGRSYPGRGLYLRVIRLHQFRKSNGKGQAVCPEKCHGHFHMLAVSSRR